LTERQPNLPTSIQSYLDRLRLRIRLWLAVDGAARALAWISLILLVSVAIDYLVDRFGEGDDKPIHALRAALLTSLGLAISMTLLRRLIRLPSRRAISSWIEQRHPEMAGRLLSSLDSTAGSTTSSELLAEAGRQATQILRQIPAKAFLSPARPTARMGGAMLATMTLGLLAWSFPGVSQAWIERLWHGRRVEYPRWTSLRWGTSTEQLDKVGRGREADVFVEVVAGTSEPSEVRIDVRSSSSSPLQLLTTRTPTGQYRALLRQLTEDVDVRARGGDARTPWRTIRVVDPPVVSDGRVEVVPPKYTRLSPINHRLAGSPISVPCRSEIKALVRFSKTLRNGTAKVNGQQLPAKIVEPNLLEINATIDKDVSIRIEATDNDGIDLAEPFSIDLTSKKDEPPKVDASLVGLSSAITPQAIIPIRIQAEDDFGVGRVSIDAAAGSRTILERAPIDGEPPWGKRLEQVQRLDAAHWSLQSGDSIRIRVEANDENDLTGPGRDESEEITLDVVTPEEWLSRLAARELLLRQRMEQVVNELLDARTSLERVTSESAGDSPTEQTARRLALDRAKSTLRKDLGESQSLGQAFADLGEEIQNNRIENKNLLERIQGNIVEPIRRWVSEPFPVVIAQLEAIPDPPLADQLRLPMPNLDSLIADGEQILAAMRKLESFQEVVSLLRSIMEDQNHLREATQRKEKERTLDILRD
jgi:hypothetical protein